MSGRSGAHVQSPGGEAGAQRGSAGIAAGSGNGQPSTGRLLTAEEVAEILGMRVDYVYALSRRNKIPHLRLGRTLRFRADAIDAWIRAAERGTLPRST